MVSFQVDYIFRCNISIQSHFVHLSASVAAQSIKMLQFTYLIKKQGKAGSSESKVCSESDEIGYILNVLTTSIFCSFLVIAKSAHKSKAFKMSNRSKHPACRNQFERLPNQANRGSDSRLPVCACTGSRICFLLPLLQALRYFHFCLNKISSFEFKLLSFI